MSSTAANLSISVQRFRLPVAMKWGWMLLIFVAPFVSVLSARAAAPLCVVIVAWMVFAIVAELARRPASLEVSARGISIDNGGLFPASSAALGLIEARNWGVPVGVALTFTQGDSRFCLGGSAPCTSSRAPARENIAVILLRVPGAPPLSIAVPDVRLAWRDAVAPTGEPHCLLGGPDWLALLACFEDRSYLVITDPQF